MLSHNDILDMVANWLLNYADDNGQSVAVDTDGFAQIRGTFDLNELVEIITEEIM